MNKHSNYNYIHKISTGMFFKASSPFIYLIHHIFIRQNIKKHYLFAMTAWEVPEDSYRGEKGGNKNTKPTRQTKQKRIANYST